MMGKVKLGDVGIIITGNTPKTSEELNYSSNDICFVKPSDISNDGISYIRNSEFYISEFAREKARILPANSVLVSCIGIIGKVGINQKECAFNQQINAIIPNEEKCVTEYLAYAIYAKKMMLQAIANAPVVPILNKTQFSDIEIFLPSLSEQKEVVKKLNNIDSVIYKRKRQLEKLDELIKARFVELFGNSENKLPIGEMCNVTGGYSFKSGDISNDGAIKILQIGNVYLDNVSWETTNYLPEGYDEKYSKFMLNEGDIVVALTRPIIQLLGNVKACIVKSSDLPCLLNQRVGRIVAKNKKTVFLEFIYGCLMTDDFTRYVESCSIGCSQPNISTKDIENYLIPNATYEEQKAYVEFKKQTDKSKLVVQKSLDKLELLKKALMQKYFE
ncbi:MAG: restriction endonuclease subunit S [Clostridia bacterium]|nr:restriction endonuclease subunit S [Clostridia bacterium]